MSVLRATLITLLSWAVVTLLSWALAFGATWVAVVTLGEGGR